MTTYDILLGGQERITVGEPSVGKTSFGDKIFGNVDFQHLTVDSDQETTGALESETVKYPIDAHVASLTDRMFSPEDSSGAVNPVVTLDEIRGLGERPGFREWMTHALTASSNTAEILLNSSNYAANQDNPTQR